MSFTVTINVVPASGMQKVVLAKNGTIKVYLTSQPERGRANKELIKFLARVLCIPQQAIAILKGDTARTKKLLIEGQYTYDSFLKKLNVLPDQAQTKIFD
jgi:uncharacterized protein (TIGR00251 family)